MRWLVPEGYEYATAEEYCEGNMASPWWVFRRDESPTFSLSAGDTPFEIHKGMKIRRAPGPDTEWEPVPSVKEPFEATVLIHDDDKFKGIHIPNEYIKLDDPEWLKNGWRVARVREVEEGKVPAQENVTCPQILAAENEGMP